MKSLFLLSSALISPSAESDPARDPRDPNQIIVVASGVEQRAEEVGRSVTVIEREELERRQTVSVADVLATTPGISVTRSGGLGGLTSVRIRGAEADQTLVLIDGVRVNDPASPSASFNFGSLQASNVERVEVLRGANSVTWGSQAIGGVVNVVTALPTNGFAGRASAEYGYGNHVATNATLSGGNDRVQGAVSAGYLRQKAISQAAVGTELDAYSQKYGSARLKVALAPDWGVDLRGSYAHSRIETDGFPAPAFKFADTADYSKSQEVYGYAGVYGQIGPVKSRFGFSIADINRDSYEPVVQAAPRYLFRGRSERYEYQGDAVLSDQIRLVFGAERENLRFNDGSATVGSGTTSFYGEAIITPVERVTITGGIRNDDHSRFGGHVSWGVSAAIRATDSTTLRGSVGEGFKAPTLYQLFAPYYGTATLKPETSKSWEVGINQSLLDGKIRASATWFDRDTKNQIDFENLTFTYQNIARTRAKGLELELALRPVDALSFSANYTLVDAENRAAGFVGKKLTARPRDVASVSVDWTSPIGLSIGSTVSIVGASFNDKANLTRLEGYALLGIRAELPLSERLSLYGRVDNLTNERYEVFSGYGTYGRAAYGGVRVRFN